MFLINVFEPCAFVWHGLGIFTGQDAIHIVRLRHSDPGIRYCYRECLDALANQSKIIRVALAATDDDVFQIDLLDRRAQSKIHERIYAVLDDVGLRIAQNSGFPNLCRWIWYLAKLEIRLIDLAIPASAQNFLKPFGVQLLDALTVLVNR